MTIYYIWASTLLYFPFPRNVELDAVRQCNLILGSGPGLPSFKCVCCLFWIGPAGGVVLDGECYLGALNLGFVLNAGSV